MANPKTSPRTRTGHRSERADVSRRALVLGAGGTVGISYHAGVIKGLAEAGLDLSNIDLIVGTSAGAVVGSIVRYGHDVDEVWELARTDKNPFREDEPLFRPEVVFTRGWKTPAGLARRTVGAGYVLQRSLLKVGKFRPPEQLQRFYRGGMSSVTELRDEYLSWTGEEWPEGELRLCAFDIVSGTRIVLGEPGRKNLPLPDAMRASSAVPFLYPPVKLDRRILVDGVVHSSTNVDVAVDFGATAIFVAAPLAYDPQSVPPPHLRASKEVFHNRLKKEMQEAKKAGVELLAIRPDAEEARVHGLNLLRSGEPAQSAELARQRTKDLMKTDRGKAFRKAWDAASPSGSAPTRVTTNSVTKTPSTTSR